MCVFTRMPVSAGPDRAAAVAVEVPHPEPPRPVQEEHHRHSDHSCGTWRAAEASLHQQLLLSLILESIKWQEGCGNIARTWWECQAKCSRDSLTGCWYYSSTNLPTNRLRKCENVRMQCVSVSSSRDYSEGGFMTRLILIIMHSPLILWLLAKK